ncbi:MAG TPA: multiheme c-type cytochrome [Desulfobacterales bacterium]
MKRMRNCTTLGMLALVLIIWSAGLETTAEATQQYAEATGKGCRFCHRDNLGGPLNTAGWAYARSGYQYPIPAASLEQMQRLQSSLHQFLRLLSGYLHLLAAAVLVGAIFYVHLFIGPAKLSGGIPRGERLLGITALTLLTLTGAYLTWTRIGGWNDFFESTFGQLLFFKILLFVLMLISAAAAVTVVHRRLKKTAAAKPAAGSGITTATLDQYDGRTGKPAYIAYNDGIFDVSASAKWKDGRHFGKHRAVSDLTDAMAGAPHGAEVLENVPRIGDMAPTSGSAKKPPVRKVFTAMAYLNMVLVLLILLCVALWNWDGIFHGAVEKRPPAASTSAARCVDCHRKLNPVIFQDWDNSIHSKVAVDCLKCHQVPAESKFLENRAHLEHTRTPIASVVSPKTCAGCHPDQYNQYARSKHANTHAIMWSVHHWLKDGMNNEIERTTGCYACHGTVVELVDGRPSPGSWPNVGVGRINPDGSRGSCSSCHTRHRFSVIEARKPEACDQCHLGPDHPQIEIYEESKHGTIYHAEQDQWNWQSPDGRWQAGRDYRAPTCAVCHMSPAAGIAGTHDVTERLSWELQTPRTIRPSEFEPHPAATRWQDERAKMQQICRQCHSKTWTEAHYTNLDRTVEHYNRNYFDPIKSEMGELYRKGLLSSTRYFDEPLEWEFYEFWHHEGRRARMGTAMMAPDYAWWHGFYELKHRFAEIRAEIHRLSDAENSEPYAPIPGRIH